MESCPHCHFLVHDDARSCAVCGRPLVLAAVDGTTAVDSVRVGPGHATGVPIAVVVLMLLVLVFAAGAGVANAVWG